MAVTINGSTGIEYDDNVKHVLGTGDDTSIFFDGTRTAINTGSDTSNELRLLTAAAIRLGKRTDATATHAENMFRALPDGAVELYHNGTKRLETTADGIEVEGHVVLGDGEHVKLGSATNGDLQIYHSSDQNYIKVNGDGRINLLASEVRCENAAGNEVMAKFIADGACELRYNDTVRFETNNYGAKVKGHLYLDDTHKVNLGTSQDLELYHASNESWIKNNTGTLNILNDGTLQIKNNADNETIAQFIEGGACKFWYNTSQKFETTNDGCKIDGNLTLHTGTSSQIHFYDVDTHTITLYTSSTHFRWWSEVDGDAIAEIQQDGDMVIDGSYSTAGVDYAEYFESTDGSAIPVGTTVILENGKVRAATDSETPIGVVRPKTNGTSITGGLNELKWQGKYLTDDYDDAVLEDATFCTWKEDEELKQAWKDSGETIPADATETPMKRRKLNPDFDKSKTYVPRSQRAEWNCVGLLGQIPITKGQPTATNWIKMKERSSTVELWMVK